MLSAIIGGAASRVFRAATLQIATTEFTLDEVNEYVPSLARKRNLPEWELLLALETIPLQVYARADYRSKLREAHRRIGARDPDDVDLLALALWLEAPLWTNDRDFETSGVRCYTTAQLLGILSSDEA